MIRIVDVTHEPVVPFHDVRFHGAVAVTKISFCWWWVHVSQYVNLSPVLPNLCGQTSPSPHPNITPFQFQLFWSKVTRHTRISSVGPHCLTRFYLTSVQTIKSLGDEKKLSINILCPKPSTLLVKCLTVECVAVMSSVAKC